MAVERVTVLFCEVDDRAGALEDVLVEIGNASVDLHALLAYERAGSKARIYALPKAGQRTADFDTAEAIRITGPDALGAGAATLKPLADRGISLRACLAVELGGQMELILILDDVDAALAAL